MTSTDGRIRIAVLCGSVRPRNYTRMAVDVVVASLSAHPDISVDVVDPSELDLLPPGLEGTSSSVSELQEAVRGATAVILATPEYHGSFSSVMKLMIENLGFPSVLAGKPVALLGVAGGSIGAIKSLEQLRGVCSHVGALVLPGPVSVAHVRSVFNEIGECTDSDVEGRLRGLAENLLAYIHQNVCPRMTLEAMVRAG
ncbi:MAG: NAD(P)H-dependent oxidoreductase [Gemmatimonadetes bacterium]|nr:NAD(P)H-dependent oxidoreductase [Gemmatimonadota bacterium]